MILAAQDQNLCATLEKLQSNLLYQSPELLNSWGDEVGQTLYDVFGAEPTENWQKNVVKHWMEILDADNNPYGNENIVFDKLPKPLNSTKQP